jgi:hypothetical protein
MTNHAGARLAAAAVILVSSLACGATPTEPQPVYEQKRETYTGTLSTQGALAFHFTVTNPGDITLVITQLAPSVTMGLSMGSWDATTSLCSQELTTNAATVNAVFSGSPSGPGEYCVGIFDVGNVQAATEFTMNVTHY